MLNKVNKALTTNILLILTRRLHLVKEIVSNSHLDTKLIKYFLFKVRLVRIFSSLKFRIGIGMKISNRKRWFCKETLIESINDD